MQLGDRKTEVIHMGQDGGITKTGTVVYIHPQRLFYVVEFDMDQGRKLQESYYFPGRRGDDGAKAKH